MVYEHRFLLYFHDVFVHNILFHLLHLTIYILFLSELFLGPLNINVEIFFIFICLIIIQRHSHDNIYHHEQYMHYVIHNHNHIINIKHLYIMGI